MRRQFQQSIAELSRIKAHHLLSSHDQLNSSLQVANQADVFASSETAGRVPNFALLRIEVRTIPGSSGSWGD